MKTALATMLLPVFATVLSAEAPWQELTLPTLREVAASFKAPPHEYGAIQPFASWNGPDKKEVRDRIVRDFDRLAANGIFVVNLSPGRGEPKYLSPEHMDEVKFIVQEAAKRGMRLWLQDESDYPSGFAGGNITRQYPQLGMQGIVADIRVHVVPGQTLTMPVPSDTLAIFATKTSTQEQVEGVIPIPIPANPQLTWTVPNEGSTPNEPRLTWQVTFVRHVYVSSPTRNFNRDDGTRAKDAFYSLIDYLDPKATRAFIDITHQTYWNAVGDSFGKIILGFFGDEPDYTSAIPWTPNLLQEFQKEKGYDLTPYIPLWFSGKSTDESLRAKADYYDVWSAIFRSSFFGEQAEWCKQHNVEYLVHLNHEETMPALERSEGDYFRDNRYVEVPGIDNLNQLVPEAVHRPQGTWNINNNFPKLASSAAHLFGKPKVWAEEGGGLGVDGKFQLDFQLVRGVTALQIRVPVLRGRIAAPMGSTAEEAPVPPQASMIAWYTNRGAYLMSIGHPAAQVAVYHPGNSIWMGDEEADRSTTKVGWQLLAHQVDWDYFDEQSLSSVATIEQGGFKNLSGQVYKAVVVPSSLVITRTGLQRFKEFVKAGGKLIFVGPTPTLLVDNTFLNAKESPDLGFATLIEPSGNITPRVLAALPKSDVTLDAEFQRLTYTHRRWRDADMYFFFNESNQPESRIATVAGRGQAQDWDLGSGEIHPMPATPSEGDYVRLPLVLGPYEAKVVVVGPLPSKAAAGEPSWASGSTVAELNGDWTIDLNGTELTAPLKSWEALAAQAFAGPATYRKQFTLSTLPARKRLFVEIGSVIDYARLKVNGKELEAHAWQPYRWEVTNLVKAGTNEIELAVRSTARTRFGSGGPPASAQPRVYGATSAPAVGPGGSTRGSTAESGLLGPVRLVAR